MRHKQIYLSLAVLLIAALACGGGTGGGTGDGGPKVLYKDNFSSSSTGWGTGTDNTSSLEYEGGEYVFRIFDTDWLIWGTAKDQSLSDIHIDVTVKNTGQATDPTFGIICNYQDGQNFYYMGIGSDGFYAIAKYVDDELTIMSDPGGQWIFSDAISENAPSYKLGADCGQGKLVLYVDDQQIASVADTSFTQGNVGLFVRSFEEADVEVRFDDFAVIELK